MNISAETAACVKCGQPLGGLAPNGLCSRCLLLTGLEETNTATVVDAGAPDVLPSASPLHAQRFGNYELLEEIARGGMGIVYRARQISLDRIVAVKMLLGGAHAKKDFVQRFRTEAAAAASLQHPNIVAIHEVGFAEGQHFFAMDYVEGQTLAQLAAKGPLPARSAAAYLKTIAAAIHFAHERNVLHRDLKPSNVLVDSATDQPRVTDFGLAKRLEAESDLTLSGQVLGSPNYMSPEQAAAKRGAVGKRSDVYSLGAILYHLLTGRPPFQGETLTDVLQQVINNEPLAPRLLTPGVPRDLETICVKCLEKEPLKRYATAQELADELGRFLNDQPIHARPVSRSEHAWRWCRRNPVVASLAVALLLAMVVGFMGVTWQLRRVQQGEVILRRNLYTSDMNLAHQAWQEGNLERAQALLRAQFPQRRHEDLRGFEWRYLWQLCQDESHFTFANVNFAGGDIPTRVLQGLALAADGQTVIAASENTLKWLDWQQQREVKSTTAGTNAILALYSAMDQPGLVAYRSDRIRALSPTGEPLLGGGLEPEFGMAATSDCGFALSWDGTLLAAVHKHTNVTLWNVNTGKRAGPDLHLTEPINRLAFTPDARHLACVIDDTKICLLELAGGRQFGILDSHTARVSCMAFDSSGTMLASGANDSQIILWSFPEGREIMRLEGHRGGIGDLAFSPDGQWLASGGYDHTVRLWNLASRSAPTLLRGHRDAAKSVLFSRDGKRLYTGSNDGTVKVWDALPGESTNIMRNSRWSGEVAISPNGKLMAVDDYHAGTTVLWDLPSRHRLGSVGQRTRYLHGNPAFSSDSKFLATAEDEDSVQLWDSSTRQPIVKFRKTHGWSVIAFHPFKPVLVVASDGLHTWDVPSRKPVNLLINPPRQGVMSVALSPKGKWIALGMKDGSISIWNLISGRQTFSFHEHSTDFLCFSHDETLLASAHGGGEDGGRVVLYDLRGRRVLANLKAHANRIGWLAFGPDDKTLISACWDGTIRFWSVANQQVALTLAHDGGPVTSVAFSPVGNLMATTGSDGTIRIWPGAKLDDITASEKAKEKKR